jgi:hypothetical protein
MQINVVANVSGYHPATGFHLVEGESYTISESCFSDIVFTKIDVEE